MITWRGMMQEFRLGDFGDAWGTTMGAWFSVACELYNRGANVPDAWKFRPAATSGPQEVDEWWQEVFADASDADILRFGRVLTRYARILEKAGKDY
jgi:hypothetical protein